MVVRPEHADLRRPTREISLLPVAFHIDVHCTLPFRLQVIDHTDLQGLL